MILLPFQICSARWAGGTREGGERNQPKPNPLSLMVGMGIGRPAIRAGVKVVLFFGGRVLFILRKEEGYYCLLGQCYAHGIMYGEIIEMWAAWQLITENTKLQ